MNRIYFSVMGSCLNLGPVLQPGAPTFVMACRSAWSNIIVMLTSISL